MKLPISPDGHRVVMTTKPWRMWRESTKIRITVTAVAVEGPVPMPQAGILGRKATGREMEVLMAEERRYSCLLSYSCDCTLASLFAWFNVFSIFSYWLFTGESEALITATGPLHRLIHPRSCRTSCSLWERTKANLNSLTSRSPLSRTFFPHHRLYPSLTPRTTKPSTIFSVSYHPHCCSWPKTTRTLALPMPTANLQRR